jgi:putative ABC transport system permease protein
MSAAGSVLDLSLAQLALALLLVGVVITISIRQGLGIGRDLVVGSLRAVVQLYLVGLILAVVF